GVGASFILLFDEHLFGNGSERIAGCRNLLCQSSLRAWVDALSPAAAWPRCVALAPLASRPTDTRREPKSFASRHIGTRAAKACGRVAGLGRAAHRCR